MKELKEYKAEIFRRSEEVIKSASLIKVFIMADLKNIITTALTAYVEENRLPLIKRAILGANSLNMINRQSGIKGVAALNLISTDPVVADASDCGFNKAGTSELS